MDLRTISTHELLQHVIDSLGEIEKRRYESYDMIQYFDQQASDVFHKMETENLENGIGEALAYELQHLRRLRRLVKRDYYIHNGLKELFDNTGESWKNVSKILRSAGNQHFMSQKQQKSNQEWSNIEELGKVDYAMVDEEYNKKFGTLEAAFSKLKEVVESENAEKY